MLPTYLKFSEDPSATLAETLSESLADKVCVLVDENTKAHCLPKLNLDVAIIEIKSGESQKTLKTCEHIWSEMTRLEMTRKSMLINLGGGVIGDMGGFAASTFKRGIRFINIPTTLLSMVDASIGGKLGVDFNGLKNHIGVFNEPAHVIISDVFLDTLDNRQKRSGFAEIIKHALIADPAYWKEVKSLDLLDAKWQHFIRRSVELKGGVVGEDPYEHGKRKILNFGHTLGHAVESHFLSSKQPLFHGEAIAVGMILETEIAFDLGLMSAEEAEEVIATISSFYELPDLPELSFLEKTLQQDKKNQGSDLRFSLIDKIGNCRWDIPVSLAAIDRSLKKFQTFKQTN